MTDRSAHQAQREALRAGLRSPITPRRRGHEQAIDKYLKLQDRPPRAAEPGTAIQPVSQLGHSGHRRGSGHLRHEHLSINGRNVEVTEDDIGVVELSLQ